AAGADVSVTARMDKAVKAAIATIDVTAWTGIEYPEAIFDEDTGTWTSKAEVAEVPFTAFTSKKKAQRIPGRLVVRR
ncbi:IS1380 family transposase, partial [Kocuria carniphila]